jgi:hypothetical protein
MLKIFTQKQKVSQYVAPFVATFLIGFAYTVSIKEP